MLSVQQETEGLSFGCQAREQRLASVSNKKLVVLVLCLHGRAGHQCIYCQYP